MGKLQFYQKLIQGVHKTLKWRKQEKGLPTNSIKYADSGYQAWQKIQSHVVIPYKRYRKKPLTLEQKGLNRQLASFRMRVENKFREIKIFKILSDVYRNFQRKYHMRFNIIAGLVNLKCGF